MLSRTGYTVRLIVLIPFIGAIVFIVLYLVAAFLYPGGSQADKTSKGFSWINNYWCNLLNDHAINGEINPARPVAMTAMAVLGATLSAFWALFAQIIDLPKIHKLIITFSGLASMITAMFLFTSYHDTVINVAGILGIVALIGTFIGLTKSKWYGLVKLGWFNIALIVVNNILYHGGLLKYLPIVQKITFLLFLSWICLIDLRLLQIVKSKAQQAPAGKVP